MGRSVSEQGVICHTTAVCNHHDHDHQPPNPAKPARSTAPSYPYNKQATYAKATQRTSPPSQTQAEKRQQLLHQANTSATTPQLNPSKPQTLRNHDRPPCPGIDNPHEKQQLRVQSKSKNGTARPPKTKETACCMSLPVCLRAVESISTIPSRFPPNSFFFLITRRDRRPTPQRCCCAWAACARCWARRRGAFFRCARA